MAEISTKPYLIRAIHEWCEDSGYRPYIAVVVDERTQVPQEFVRNGEIVLNVSAQATHRLRIGNDFVEFEARFSGAVRGVSIPIDNISAIYAQETGHGMAFDVVRVQPSKAPVASQPRPVPNVPVRAGLGQPPPKAAELIRSVPDRAAKPRLVPKAVESGADTGAPVDSPAQADPEKRVGTGKRIDSAAQADTEAAPKQSADGAVLADARNSSQEAPAVPARKPRSPRRRAQPAGATDSNVKVEAVALVEHSGAPPMPAANLPKPAAPPGDTTAEPSAPTVESPKPARGHLKRVK